MANLFRHNTFKGTCILFYHTWRGLQKLSLPPSLLPQTGMAGLGMRGLASARIDTLNIKRMQMLMFLSRRAQTFHSMVVTKSKDLKSVL